METLSLPNDADQLSDEAVALVKDWLRESAASQTRAERHEIRRLAHLITDEPSVKFTMQFCDRVARPDIDQIAADQMARLARDNTLPSFLTLQDRTLFRIGGYLAPKFPRIIMPIARLRMRQMLKDLIVNAKPRKLQHHVKTRRSHGYDLNVNLLGESVLGDAEASRRLRLNSELLKTDDIDYISVKVSAVSSQLNLWAYDDTFRRVCGGLREIFRSAQAGSIESAPPKFVNLDMEEFPDLHLTIEVFKQVLSEPEFHDLHAGIVLQAYLPDSFAALQDLVSWANSRHAKNGGTIKIRIVKGANLAMETVDAQLHDWPQAPYGSKLESDANYKRLLDWTMHPDRMRGIRLGVASHNLFDVAWALLVSRARGVAHHVEFEMLQGMAPTQAEVVRGHANGLLLYTPTVATKDFDTAVGYLFRRLEENSSKGNFLHDLFTLTPDSEAFANHELAFRRSMELRGGVDANTYRTQDRSAVSQPRPIQSAFTNEADTDPAAPANRSWIQRLAQIHPHDIPEKITEIAAMDLVVQQAHDSSDAWAKIPSGNRREILLEVAHQMSNRRDVAIATLSSEANKIAAEADTEVSEAIDFARYYADQAVALSHAVATSFTPLGTVVVAPPWNFPYAIAAGGVLAALAAGKSTESM
ncbi:MAG: proline dehydrogenase family protein, partial [Acidimicrobiales bacterium]